MAHVNYRKLACRNRSTFNYLGMHCMVSGVDDGEIPSNCGPVSELPSEEQGY
jgi:hypothetical protein